MKIIGYGICGPGEAGRYMRETLEEFKRLCDEVIILCNNCDQAELDLVDEFGFSRVTDRREWGAHQWRIKQDFIERDILQIAEKGDMIVCLDMDETIPKLTKEWLQTAELDAYHVFIADLWNDPEHYKLESCFWNVRIWRWNGETKFKAKPVHCGLAPEWAYHYHRHAPFVLCHKGLMTKETREKKLLRYAKYDPNAEHLDKRYYDMLKSDSATAFDFDAISLKIEEEVATYNQSKPRKNMADKKKPRFAYVRNPHGMTVDIPEKHLAQTLKRKDFTFISWADEDQEDIEKMFDDTEVDGASPSFQEHPGGSYQRSHEDEEKEIEERNANEDKDTNSGDSSPSEDKANESEAEQKPPNPMPNPNEVKKPEPKVEAPKKTTPKKVVKKTAGKKKTAPKKNK